MSSYRHNGREVEIEPHTDFAYPTPAGVPAERELRECRVEFELAQKLVAAVAEAPRADLAADQVLWLFGWSPESARTLARRHDYSHTGFIDGARKLAAGLGLKLPADLR